MTGQYRGNPISCHFKKWGLRRDYTPAPQKDEIIAYLHGAAHDGTHSKAHKTFRISQKYEDWLMLIKALLGTLNIKSWIYKEGMNRNIYVLETSDRLFLTKHLPRSGKEKIAYIRGYFDSEGGFPKSLGMWQYIQFSQKNLLDLIQVKTYLEQLSIICGKTHNPTQKDKSYFRFYISRKSHNKFMSTIGSWHPRKSRDIEYRMKI